LQDEPKPFLTHLEELRWTLIKSFCVLGITMTLCGIFVREIMAFLQAPLRQVVEARHQDAADFLFTLNVVDPLTLTIQTALFAGLITSFPFLFYFIGEFVLPALRPKERNLLIPAFSAGGLLFVGGVAFCYFVILPQAVRFFIEWNEWFGWRAQWPIQSYIEFVLQMLVAFGLSFELPLVVAILSALGIVHTSFLRSHRRHAIVVLVVFCACITPTSDPFTLSMMFGPMYLLFEGSILVSAVIERRRNARLAAEGLLPDDLD
jgi:sec-independent protein translocase protein TatC